MDMILTPGTPMELISRVGGGKARNLALMSKKGFPIPEWVCISSEAFQLFLHGNSLERLVQTPVANAEDEAKIVEAFLKAQVPDLVREQLATSLQASGLHACHVAVRSSGLDEDSAHNSFAGQFSSFLFQKGQEQILHSLKLCWASAFSQRAASYRLERGLGLQSHGMGVVVQRMIDADASGVMFSRHPLKVLDRTKILISAVWGAGEGLVSGLLDADDYEWQRETNRIESRIVKKTHALRRNQAGGLQQEEVPDDLQTIGCLKDEDVHALAHLAMRIEEACGNPQDIEWVLEKGQFFIVQTRPITHLPPDSYYDRRVNGRTPILWDNSNIIESYSGVTSPLTFSFASRAYNAVYIQFLQIMGVPQTHIESRASTFRNLLGLIRGRIYYNLGNWYELVLALPGSQNNKAFMETMMGVKQSLDPEMQSLFDNMGQPPPYSFFSKLGLLAQTLHRFIRIDAIIDDFFKGFNQVYNEARTRKFLDMPLPELMEYYYYLEDRFLKRWKAPIINDYLCMIFFGLLKKLTASWVATADEAESLQNDLLCGEGGLDSTEPTKFLMRTAARIDQGDPGFRAWFVNTPVPDALRALQGEKHDHPVGRALSEFLDRFGFRCVNELKLEVLDLHDDPSFVIQSLISYVRTKSYNVEEMEKREKDIRSQAELRLNARISGWRKQLYWFVLKQARRAVKNRENLRFARTKSFGVVRHLFRAIGSHLTTLKVIDKEMDIFYLTLDEISSYIEGRVVGTNLRQLIAMRHVEFENYRNTPSPPERFLSHGAVGVSVASLPVLLEADLLRDLHAAASQDPNKLFGTPCCPGIIEGEVRLVNDMKDAEGIDGHILVTARTDPGWVPLFPSCSGLLVERGSLLSHSAVVARELGLPTIVGINGGLMQRLKTGDRIRIDAGKGEVTILSKGA